jgi:hypothetical protein
LKTQLDSTAVLARVVSDSTHAQIKRLLNPDQQVKLDKMRAAAQKELAERRGGDAAGGSRPPGPPLFGTSTANEKKRRCNAPALFFVTGSR